MKRILASSLLFVFVFVGGLMSLVFFPEPLFACKHAYKPFTVYSNLPVDPNMDVVLDDVLKLVRVSELYDSTYNVDVFLSYGNVFNDIDDWLLGHGPSARATDNNIVVKVDIDAARNLAFPTFHDRCQASLTWLLTHEMVHCLQDNRYGKLVFNPFAPPPMWKLEGYPEYISRRPMRMQDQYNLIDEIDRYQKLDRDRKDVWMAIMEGGCKSPWYYYKSRIMTEYLMDVKGLSYDEIMNDARSEDDVFAEVLAWRETM
jgi:hypothetical protein